MSILEHTDEPASHTLVFERAVYVPAEAALLKAAVRRRVDQRAVQYDTSFTPASVESAGADSAGGF